MTNPKPLPRIEHFEKLAYGLFLHYGLYSQLGRGEWVMFHEKIPVETYRKLTASFAAKEFDGRKIARLAKEGGMKYACLTTRHHDGFSLYDTRGLNDYDAPHSSAKRDLVADFVQGCREEGIVPFFYHTTLDWFQKSFQDDFNGYLKYLRDSVEILCMNYGPIGGFWFDGNWSKKGADWQEESLYRTIRKHQPDTIIINNTGMQARGKMGHPEIDCLTFEQARPTAGNSQQAEKYLAVEMCQTINKHWGYGQKDFHYLSPKEIIEHLCACRKCGANYLLNVGPTADGAIADYEAAAIRRVGDWVRLAGEVFYNGKPCDIQTADPDFALTANGKVYLFIHSLNVGGHSDVTLVGGRSGPREFQGVSKSIQSARWLDNGESLQFNQKSDGTFTLHATDYPYGTNMVVRIAELT